jgi:hypothetical protein
MEVITMTKTTPLFDLAFNAITFYKKYQHTGIGMYRCIQLAAMVVSPKLPHTFSQRALCDAYRYALEWLKGYQWTRFGLS